jgi:hypothetical protein
MAHNLIATLAGPAGITKALNRWAQVQANGGMSNIAFNDGATPNALLAKAGLTTTDWNNLVSALSGANATSFLRLMNAAGLVCLIEPAPFAPPGVMGWAISDPIAGRMGNTLLGDLS